MLNWFQKSAENLSNVKICHPVINILHNLKHQSTILQISFGQLSIPLHNKLTINSKQEESIKSLHNLT